MSRQRLVVTLLCGMLVVALHWTQLVYLVPLWGYWGFAYGTLTGWQITLLYALALLPSLILPVALKRPSNLLCWIFYIIVYVPSVLSVGFRQDPSYNGWALLGALAAGFLIVAGSRFLPLPAPSRDVVSPPVFWLVFAALYCICTVEVLRAFGSHLRLVSFVGVYDLRMEAREVSSLSADYLLPLLSNICNPLLMTIGLFRRRPSLFAAGAAGQLLLYMTAAMKSIVLSPLVILAMFIVLRRRSAVTWIVLGAVVLVAGATLLALTAPVGTEMTSPRMVVSSLILLRTFGIPGSSTALYADFFSKNPLTYWSHVRGIRSIVHYPYSLAVPYVIGGAYYGGEEISANAHFWAQDGIAAYGNAGVVIISLLVVVVLWLLDLSSRHLNPRFVMVFASMFGMTMTNGSIFTNLLTGGLALAMVVLRGVPAGLTEPRPAVRRRARHAPPRISPERMQTGSA